MQKQSAGPSALNWSNGELVRLVGIVIFAGLLRWLLFAGFQGSDEVTYLSAALGIFEGRWPSSTYIGSLRYGINIPMAAGLGIFGLTEQGAAAWGFLCSVAEVAVVYLAARQLGGQRMAIYAALILATLPLHVHEATRMIGDPPLSLFLALGMFWLWQGEQQSKAKSYFLAGLSFGAMYWIKDAVFFISVFTVAGYILVFRRFHRFWLHLILGALILVAANMALMQAVNGNWLHLFSNAKKSLGRIESNSTPIFYLKYLFVDLRHFWIIPFLALGGIWFSLSKQQIKNNPARLYGIWLVVFLIVLSALPLRQKNYLLLVAAPLAMFGGIFLASLERRWAMILAAVTLLGSLLLAALQQQSLHVFTANSRAAVKLADTHSDAFVYAPTGAFRADIYAQLFKGVAAPNAREPLHSLAEFDRRSAAHSLPTEKPVFVIEDPVTLGWGDKNDGGWAQRRSNNCLLKFAQLTPEPLGLGRHVANFLIYLASHVSESSHVKIVSLLRPESATVYQVVACDQAQQ